MLRTRSPRKEKISNCYLHSNSLSNKMDNSLLAVRDINHKYIVVEKEAKQLASENLKKYLDDLEEKGIQITEKNVIIERTKKKYVVKGTIGTLKSIVSYQPTKIIEQSSEERQPTDESD